MKTFLNYYVTDQGDIFHKETGKIKYSWLNQGRSAKYQRTQFYIQGKKRNIYVHRLVAMLFMPEYREDFEVNHKNGNTLDNRIENLEIVTTSENQEHAQDYYKVFKKQGKCIFKIGTVNAYINKGLYS